MKPAKPPIADNPLDLFRSQLSNIVDPRHSLVRLSKVVDWDELERIFGETFCSDNGRPAISTRLMVALHYLKFTHDLSDDAVVKNWVENPYWQYFSGMKYFTHELPIDPSSMTRWRKRIGAAGAEELLKETIKAGLKLKAVKKTQLKRVNVDTTVQEKDIRFPTDARLYDRARDRLVKAAKERGVELRQNYNRLSKQMLLKQSRYIHARQMKRAKKSTRRLRTFLGRVIRDIERKCLSPDNDLTSLLEVAHRIWTQERNDKIRFTVSMNPMLNALAKAKPIRNMSLVAK